MKKKITAFTLAEMLLTLSIIGVIAAMTIPSLKDHSDEVKYISATKKAFSTISSATTAIETRHGDAVFWKFDQQKTLDWYKEAMNLIAPDRNKPKWKITNPDGTDVGDFTVTHMTADGMAWSIGAGGYACGGGAALVDLNGPQAPNVVGIDVQGFRIGALCNGANRVGDFGVYPMGDGTNDKTATYACTAYVIKNNKMPWLDDTSIQTCQGLIGK